ncbi:MAG: hypothetical protein ACM3YO_07485, partial [Bacteroidota bacterium]
YQNVIADRISLLVGGDAVQKRYDRMGNVDVVGLSPQDLEVAIEAATMPDFNATESAKWFMENSPRAFFRNSLGREFASELEESEITRLFHTAEGKELLRKASQLLDEAFKPYPLARADVKVRASLVPTEEQMRELLRMLRNQHLDEAWEALNQTHWFQEMLLQAQHAESGHRAEMSAIRERQKLTRLLKMLENFLGKVPPELQNLMTQLLSMVQGAGEAELSNLENLIASLFEKILQAFAGMNASPEDMAEGMMAMLKALIAGQNPDKALEGVVSKKKKGTKNLGALQNAMGKVNDLRFFYTGKIGQVGETDPMVQALMSGQVDPESLEKGFADRFKGLPLANALDFIKFLNQTIRGVDLDADPFDPWVQKLVKGEMPPGKIANEWKAIYQPDLVTK